MDPRALLLAQETITDYIAAELDPRAVLGVVLRQIGETLDCSWGAAWLMDEDGNQLRCEETWEGPEQGPEQLGAKHVQLHAQSQLAEGIWQEQKPICAKYRPQESAQATIESLGIADATITGFPIAVGPSRFGVITFFASHELVPSDMVFSVFKILGGQVALFLQARELHAGRKRDVETLLEIERRRNLLNDMRFADLSYHDALTGAANRALLDEQTRFALARARRIQGSIALLHLDIDNFKLINGSLGYEAGDRLLADLTHRLEGKLRPSDLIARVGNDEFVILITDLKENPWKFAEHFADEITRTLQEPFLLAGVELQVTASMGIATSPDHGQDASTLFAHADSAVVAAKDTARGSWAFFGASSEDAHDRLTLTTRLWRAVRENELELHYQPIVLFETGAIVGVEALLRWHDPDRGMIPPGDFIPVAEETGLIEPIGEWVVRTVSEQQIDWAEKGLFPQISFNVSPRQLARPDFVDRIATQVLQVGADTQRLTVELTESTTLRDEERSELILRRLHELGFNVAVDDFGAGYSSLSRLRTLQVETLKVDRAFLRDVPANPEASAMVSAILSLAKALGREAVAEGVETEAQRDFLIAQGFALGQGFLLAKPMPVKDVTELMLQAGNHAPAVPTKAALRR